MTLRLLPLLVLLVGCSAADPVSEGALRVLYVGNSLTYTHDLPAVVGELAAMEGRAYHAEDLSEANAGLEDHWARGDAQRRIAAGDWDVVVLQQGPSTLVSSRETLIEYVGRFAEGVREAGATPAVFMVWPPVGTPIERSEVSYAAAADAHGAVLLPAGRAWRIALEADPPIALYGPDGFHPSRLGTALAALAVYGGLTGSLPDTLPGSLDVGGEDVPLSTPERERLLDAARRALASS